MRFASSEVAPLLFAAALAVGATPALPELVSGFVALPVSDAVFVVAALAVCGLVPLADGSLLDLLAAFAAVVAVAVPAPPVRAFGGVLGVLEARVGVLAGVLLGADALVAGFAADFCSSGFRLAGRVGEADLVTTAALVAVRALFLSGAGFSAVLFAEVALARVGGGVLSVTCLVPGLVDGALDAVPAASVALGGTAGFRCLVFPCPVQAQPIPLGPVTQFQPSPAPAAEAAASSRSWPAKSA